MKERATKAGLKKSNPTKKLFGLWSHENSNVVGSGMLSILLGDVMVAYTNLLIKTSTSDIEKYGRFSIINALKHAEDAYNAKSKKLLEKSKRSKKRIRKEGDTTLHTIKVLKLKFTRAVAVYYTKAVEYAFERRTKNLSVASADNPPQVPAIVTAEFVESLEEKFKVESITKRILHEHTVLITGRSLSESFVLFRCIKYFESLEKHKAVQLKNFNFYFYFLKQLESIASDKKKLEELRGLGDKLTDADTGTGVMSSENVRKALNSWIDMEPGRVKKVSSSAATR